MPNYIEIRSLVSEIKRADAQIKCVPFVHRDIELPATKSVGFVSVIV